MLSTAAAAAAAAAACSGDASSLQTDLRAAPVAALGVVAASERESMAVSERRRPDALGESRGQRGAGATGEDPLELGRLGAATCSEAGRTKRAARRAYRMRLPVRMRIHWGIGLFCFSFLARVFFVRIVLLAGCARHGEAW